MLIGFRNTHNQDVFVNPAQVLYIGTFEEEVTIIALAITSAGGRPFNLYVRGHLDFIRQRLESGQAFPSRTRSLDEGYRVASPELITAPAASAS